MTVEPDDELLSAYLDGEVTPDERTVIDEALARSAPKRVELARLAEARDAVRGLGDPELPVGFLTALERAVADGSPTRITEATDANATPGADRDRARPRRGLAWLAGGAAAAVLLAALVVPSPDRVDPAVRTRVDAHAARASVTEDPVSELAPVAAAGGLPR